MLGQTGLSNSADPDQTVPQGMANIVNPHLDQTALSSLIRIRGHNVCHFFLHLLDALLHCKTNLFHFTRIMVIILPFPFLEFLQYYSTR